MTKDDIIRMAREAWGEHHEIFWFDDDGIERFAALLEAKVRADEREACANVCEAEGKRVDASWVGCAAAIRARGEK
jgi:hypothetical protein